MPQFHTNQQFGGCFVAALSYKKFTPGECVASFAFAHGIAIKGKTYSEERPMPNPCNCFATCTLSDANRFLERIPRVVTSASSPWLSYLRFVYGAEPPLPFELSKLRFWYHRSTQWQRLPNCEALEWPMPACATPRSPVEPKVILQLAKVHDRPDVGSLAPQCDATKCNLWMSSENASDINFGSGAGAGSSTAYAAVQLFKMPDYASGSSIGSVLILRGDSASPSDLAADSEWVEVMRYHTANIRGAAGFEGTAGYGCWFFLARGSGIYVNVGERSMRVHNEAELVPPGRGKHHRDAECCSPGCCRACCAPHTFTGQWARWRLAHNASTEAADVDIVTSHKERYPAQAHAMGFTSIQMGGFGASHAQLVLTVDACASQPAPIRTCVPVPTRAGWQASRPCVCDDDHGGDDGQLRPVETLVGTSVLNCGGGRGRGAKTLRREGALPSQRATTSAARLDQPSPTLPTLVSATHKPRAHPRAALIWTGLLRASCGSDAGIERLVRQAELCRRTFGGACDIFIHTWSRLDKAADFGSRAQFGGRCHGLCQLCQRCEPGRSCPGECWSPRPNANASSWPCVGELTRRVSPAAVVVEAQPQRSALPAPPPAWSHFLSYLGEDASANLVANFAMNSASIASGVRLMLRHAASMRISYDVAIRMRADFGGLASPDLTSQFLDTVQRWERVREVASRVRAADLQSHDASPPPSAAGLVMCDRPRTKRIDFCFWSAPPAPLVRTVLALEAELQALVPECQAYLNGTLRQEMRSIFQESIMLCAMGAAGVSGISGSLQTPVRPRPNPAQEIPRR